jgi:hypothetical protein
MTAEHPVAPDPPTQAALRELQELIQAAYPDASFAVVRGEDPEGLYLRATVDVEELDQVVDVFIERLVELQVEAGLPVYVIPLEPAERALAAMRTPSLTWRSS